MESAGGTTYERPTSTFAPLAAFVLLGHPPALRADQQPSALALVAQLEHLTLGSRLAHFASSPTPCLFDDLARGQLLPDLHALREFARELI